MITQGTLPPKRPRYVFPVVRARPGQPLHCVISCKDWISVDVHWNGNKNVICPGQLFCDQCKKSPPIWQGFLTIERVSDRKQGLLQFTPNIVPKLMVHRSGDDGLTGLVVTLGRLGQRKNSPLAITTHNPRESCVEITMPEVTACVQRVFGVRLRQQP